jgi:acetyltransferase-like isoleucine patch superfamily enzyme
MKNQLIQFVKRYPFLVRLALLFRHRAFFQAFRQWKVQGTGNRIEIDSGAFCHHCTIDIVGNSNTIIIEPGARLHNLTFYIRGNHHTIHLCANVWFNRGGSLWMEDEHGLIHIGERTAVEEAHIAVTENHSKITIGADCLLASGIEIRSGDSHSLINRATGKRFNYAQDVVIADHVWIAAHSSILKGVQLARNTVVATRSVVTNSFEREGVIIAGNPAKIIREDIDWNFRRI